MTGMLAAAAAALVVAPAVAAATAAAPAYVIQGDRAVGGLVIARGTPADARARFGAPSTTRAFPPSSCVMSWRELGLAVRFLDLSGGRACRSGVAVTATVTSRARWRTALGLRVGDSVARLRQLFPRARLHRGFRPWAGYWLVTRRACAEVGGHPYPGLLARARDGRVTVLVAGTAACE